MTSPAAAYNFDEPEGDVQDYSGNGRSWSLNNNALRMAGHTGNGLTKLGTGMPVIAEPGWIGTEAWTFMFWQWRLGNGTWWLRMYNNSDDTGSGILNLGGTLRLRIRRPSGNTEVSVAPPSDDQPHHYAGTYDGVNGRLYIDATLVGTTAIALSPTSTVDRIDCAEHSLNEFYMDDLRFFDGVALGQPAIATLMNTPVTADVAASSRWQRGDGVSLTPYILTGSGLVEME
jgi:hypothetical protein